MDNWTILITGSGNRVEGPEDEAHGIVIRRTFRGDGDEYGPHTRYAWRAINSRGEMVGTGVQYDLESAVDLIDEVLEEDEADGWDRSPV